MTVVKRYEKGRGRGRRGRKVEIRRRKKLFRRGVDSEVRRYVWSD